MAKRNHETTPFNVYSSWQTLILTALRVFIGWHFLYEGLVKLLNPYWSAAGYLVESRWLFSGLFKAIVADPSILTLVDFLNIWGLILVGLGLMLGIFTRTATAAGMTLLALYYLSNPPFPGFTYSMPAEGNYIIVNKNWIEFFSLWVLYLFPTGRIFGLDRFFCLIRGKIATRKPEVSS
jgi:thiosulfate dehydrogenase [quinone] large subunit